MGNASFGLVDHNASLSFTIRYDCAAGFTQPLDDVKVVLAARSVPYPLDGAAHAVISVQVGNMVCGATFTADLPPTPFDPPAPAPYSFSQPPAGTWRFALLASTPATTHDYRNFPGQVTLNPSQTSFRDVQVTGVAAETATAVEYYHGPFDHYFVTANPDEVAALDAGSFSGWSRTGKSFRVYMNAATVPAMCRFFSTSFGQLSSHFYTSNVDECASVKANPNWLYEGLVFHVSAPADDGTCPFDSQSLYRLYNNGQGGAPNHRYTTSFDVRAEMLARGWIPEGHGTVGVVACTPL